MVLVSNSQNPLSTYMYGVCYHVSASIFSIFSGFLGSMTCGVTLLRKVGIKGIIFKSKSYNVL